MGAAGILVGVCLVLIDRIPGISVHATSVPIFRFVGVFLVLLAANLLYILIRS